MNRLTRPQFLSKKNKQLFLALLLMTACFFTWSENIVITRAIKVVGRMGVLFSSYSIYKSILDYGAVDNLKWKNVISPLLYGVYLFLGFCSLLWSTDVGYSALQLFMTAQTVVFCYFFIRSIYILDEFYPEHTIRFYNLIGNTVFVLILVFVIGMWVDPDTFYRLTNGGEEARLGGYLMNPNELGMLSGVGVAGLLFDIKRKHHVGWTIFKLIIIFYGLYETGSRSSLIGAFLIISFHLKQLSDPKIIITASLVVMSIMPYAVNKIILKDGDPERLEEILTLTGRLPFWTALINEGLPREPLLGFGFMRIDYTDAFQSANTYAGKMTHNTFMQVLLNLGFVGITVVLFQMIFTFKGIAKEKEETKLMLYCLLIPLIINSFTEFGIFGESNYGILFYQLVFMYISFGKNPILTFRQRIELKKRRPDLSKELEKTGVINGNIT
jgi:exopolysaccharide production protein ExoQ